MAKKQQKNQANQTTPPDVQSMIKDKDQEILLVYDNQTGDIQAIGNLDVNKGKYDTLLPTPKNFGAMYDAGNSSVVGTFLKNFLARSEVPKNRFSFFRAPIVRINDAVCALNNRFNKVDDPDGSKLLNRYFINERKLKKIKYDYKQLPLTEMKSIGLTREILEEMDELKNLQEGLTTNKRFPVHYSINGAINHADQVVLKAYEDPGSGEIKIRTIPALAQPEFLDKKYQNVFSKTDEENFYNGMPLDRAVQIENPDTGEMEWSLVNFNPETNRLVPVPLKEVEIPYSYNFGKLDETKRAELQRGSAVQVTGCSNYAKDASYNAVVKYNPITRNLMEIQSKREYLTAYIPPSLKKQMDPEDMKEFLRGKPLDGKNYLNKLDKPYENFMIVMNPKNNQTEWLDKTRNDKMIKEYQERYAKLTNQQLKQEPFTPAPETPVVEEIPEMDFDQELPQQSTGPRIGA